MKSGVRVQGVSYDPSNSRFILAWVNQGGLVEMRTSSPNSVYFGGSSHNTGIRSLGNMSMACKNDGKCALSSADGLNFKYDKQYPFSLNSSGLISINHSGVQSSSNWVYDAPTIYAYNNIGSIGVYSNAGTILNFTQSTGSGFHYLYSAENMNIPAYGAWSNLGAFTKTASTVADAPTYNRPHLFYTP